MDSATSMMVAEAALSALFQRLVDTLAFPFLKRLGSLFGVEEEAKKLKSTLSRIEALLTDAEERQIKEESVRLWLSELKDVAYDAEDILDELAYLALRTELESPIQTRKRKLTELVPHFFSRFTSNFGLGSRIKKIRERLDEIETENRHLNLKAIHGSERLLIPKVRRPPTGSIIDEPVVFGRETEREEMVNLLTSDSSSSSSSSAEDSIWVVPICGMGGLGKTTLAQLVYNDERVVKHFGVRAWVYVSEDLDLTRLAKAIVESVTGRACHLTNLDTIQFRIKKALNEKRFLLVLDDIWNDDCDYWDALRAPLMVGARGSRILVTTRSQRVSLMMGTVPTYSLLGLLDDACWSLFERRAFAQGDLDAHPDLVMIGKRIVKKCNGLPLAVKTLGGLLRYKVDVVEWEAILKSEIWDLPEERNDILPALRLSYHHLPAHLKQCFAYCCIFSKGYTMGGHQLVLMWMAQGFIQPRGCKQMEEVGREYLDDLVSRSLINHSVSTSVYTMHDLTHDLARSVSGADFSKKSHKIVEKVCLVSGDLFKSSMESFNYKDVYRFKSLRALSLSRHLVLTIPADLFVNLRHLRILNLKGNYITELPESIENLSLLRYLDLTEARIERLPKSTTRLYNLQTLILDFCENLVELPSDFSNLANLRHLSLYPHSVSIPPKIGRLTNLQKLEHFKVGKEIGCRINELKGMIHLRGSLCISTLDNVVNVEEAKQADLKNKQKIDKLQLKCEPVNVELRQVGIEEEVLNGLQPHTNLRELKIEGYCGVRFPTWLGDSLFSNLVSINLYSCRCHLLPPFGQLPSLKHLRLYKLCGVKKVGHEFCGDGRVKGFPSLESLYFESMPDLEEWSGLEGDISHVSKIAIRNCSNLSALPLFPHTLESIEIRQCEKLATVPRVSVIRDLTLSRCDEQILSSLQYLTSLSSLQIFEFPNLASLPNGLLQSLTGLQQLMIANCDQLMYFTEEVGLQHLTSLCSLQICNCPELTSLGDEVLPATLESLYILQCINLNCLPVGLQHLTSLVKLELISCPKIHSLPEELPTTLQSLNIRQCPLLKEKCQEGGNYWCTMSHIPNLTIDGIRISSS